MDDAILSNFKDVLLIRVGCGIKEVHITGFLVDQDVVSTGSIQGRAGFARVNLPVLANFILLFETGQDAVFLAGEKIPDSQLAAFTHGMSLAKFRFADDIGFGLFQVAYGLGQFLL